LIWDQHVRQIDDFANDVWIHDLQNVWEQCKVVAWRTESWQVISSCNEDADCFKFLEVCACFLM